MRKVASIFITSINLFCFFTLAAHAEISANITLTPENPLPNSTVTLSLESYSFDVNTAMITWQVAGRTILSGQGERALSIKTGNVGDTTTVTVRANVADGSYIQQSIKVTPSSVTLLYEAPQSYVPLLYEGRSLPADGALVRVSALPEISDNGRPVSPSNLSYTWYMNDTVVRNMSGLGRQSALFRLDYLNTKDEIKVIVRSPLGNTAMKTINIYPHSVMPLIYTYNQILGSDFATVVYQRFETVRNFTFKLEPFYVSINEDKEPTYTWFLDRLPSTPTGGRILSLQPQENSYGTKMLSIDVTGPDKRVQKGSTKVELIFDTRK